MLEMVELGMPNVRYSIKCVHAQKKCNLPYFWIFHLCLIETINNYVSVQSILMEKACSAFRQIKTKKKYDRRKHSSGQMIRLNRAKPHKHLNWLVTCAAQFYPSYLTLRGHKAWVPFIWNWWHSFNFDVLSTVNTKTIYARVISNWCVCAENAQHLSVDRRP